MILRGWAHAHVGQADVGLRQLDEGLDAWRATGAEGWVPYFLSLLADASRQADQAAGGIVTVNDACARVDSSGANWIAAELHRQRGTLLLSRADSDPAAAEACFRQAIDVARAQGAKGWELRAVTALASLWGDRGRRAEAHDLLAPVYGWFTEGFDTQDLKDAKALLDQLA